jgi:hypothetical protein
MTRRQWLVLLGLMPSVVRGQRIADPPVNRDWVCPMDPDYRSDKPGNCPRCGMKLVLGIPERVEFDMQVSHSPALLKPGDMATIDFHIFDPRTGKAVSQFEIVHEKLIHLFVVSENLEFFAHIHPTLQPDNSFQQRVRLPDGGMYRLLADFYPAGSVPQLALATVYVSGDCRPAKLVPSLAPDKAKNLTASLRLEPEHPIAGLETRLYFSLDPSEGLEPYLGAWAHMLTASADLIDLMHLHPFLRNPDGTMEFNLLFPRPGLYRIWTQFQRMGVVNTVVFTVPVTSL